MFNVLISFMQQVNDHPDSTAISHGDSNITYREINHKSDILCWLLQQAGVKHGDIIPLITLRTPEFIIGIIAILKSGASYIPVDIHYPQKRIIQITEQCDAPVILISHGVFSSIIGTSAKCVIAIDRDIENTPLPIAPVQVAPDDTAYVIFTSGTTGVPKGVMVSHTSLYNLVSWHNSRFEMNLHSRSSLIAGISFDVAQWEIWSPLICGATLILPDNEETRLQTDILLRFFVTRGITHGFIPTVLVAEFINQAQPDDIALRYLFTAGEKLNPVNLSHIRYPLVDYYGPTEATIFTTCNLVECATQNPVANIGFPIAGAEVFILDEHLLPVVDGQSGEIFIAGPGLASGYLNKPELTKEKFLTLPSAPEKRLYRSGDRARRLPDGRIQFLGRLDDQVKIRGNRIELGEIESVLMQVEGVTAAVVLVAEEESPGEKKILAFVAAENVSQSILRGKLAETLPVYFMPAVIKILPHLPLTQNGKTDKHALLAGYRSDAPDASNTVFRGLEGILAVIWKNLLGADVPTSDDNFFDLGGHSLLAAKLAATITAQTAIRAYVRDIYDSPTIRSLAQTLDERSLSAPLTADSEPLRILQDDVFLPDDIHFSMPFDERQISTPNTIFLTGTTGFVGSHLLADLLQSTHANIYCLVRGKNTEQAWKRINETLTRYAITLPVELHNRIHPLAGDLAEPYFALEQGVYQQLCQETDIIYHSASAVNFIQPYSWMKRDNVQGLREILRFAASVRTKPLMLLSTISVYSWGHLHTGKQVMREDDNIDQNLPAVVTDIGYVRSKWVMEKIADLAASRGLPLMTFRLGYATCHSKTGVSADYQWWGRLVKTCLDTKTVPILRDLREGLTTVDYMTQAIATITRNPLALGRKFNLIHDQKNNLTLEAFFQQLENDFGFKFKRLPFTDWLAQWEHNADAPLYPLLSLFKDNMTDGQSTVQLYQDTYLWDCSNVKHFLQGSSVQEPLFNRDLLARYLQRSICYNSQV
ncbi:non-ribosomal peptide synthetase [Serratia sp. 14-2641]|uniref:non-ribosomal peptide synthetase n=1 Tax=Serratia sp. 14-2641 TaxID=1841657 RepID=UPI00080FE484|nr:non-ribosomal peptide synthetase [Serratia sp. 14-2641]OCJ32616.1 peptide synthetase [Serratia sp. 14-2641]